jgi:quinol monooxygenase YgiN
MINVIASIQLNPGNRAAFLEAFKANVPNVLAERGCIEYTPAVDLDADLPPQVLDESSVTVIEKWESLAALRDHLQAPHMLAHKEVVKEMVDHVSLKILQEA